MAIKDIMLASLWTHVTSLSSGLAAGAAKFQL